MLAFNFLCRSVFFYLRLSFGSWSKHDEHIGAIELPPDVNDSDFIGSEKETRYAVCFRIFLTGAENILIST